MTFLNVGIAIISGIGIGILFGFLISLFFNNFEINNINKILILIAIGAGLVVLEIFVEKWFIFSSLLAVIVMCLIVRIKNKPLSLMLAKNTSQIWVVAEMFLFFSSRCKHREAKHICQQIYFTGFSINWLIAFCSLIDGVWLSC